MNLIPYLVVAGIICIAGLIGTIMIGINPNDDNYEKKTKKHFTTMSVIYLLTFVPAVILTIVYFIYW
ncbi:hypothetical protein ACM26V_06375 [Salipaludibacillus sp. HK11]|uniref:hypothetical protein n=1 Tax=Salipaludibacillus sp. HK11 TaxID=3394320 RepID=UPI0039FD4C95